MTENATSTILIAGLIFSGPISSRKDMPHRPAILAVLDVAEDGTCKPIDAFFTKCLRSDVARPAKWHSWLDLGKGRIAYAYLDTSRWSNALVSRMMAHLRSGLPEDWWDEHWSNPLVFRAAANQHQIQHFESSSRFNSFVKQGLQGEGQHHE